jgi:hypothetical protein
MHQKKIDAHSYDLVGFGARAAGSFALLSLVREAVKNFEEGSFGTSDAMFASMDVCVLNSKGSVTSITRAARAVSARRTKFFLFGATRLFASELAFGFGAKSGSFAFPGALGFLAERSTVGFRSSASGSADSRTADGFASRAIFHFAHFLGTADRADGLFAVNFTFGTFRGFAVHLAFGTSTNRMTFGGTDRVVTQPFALRVASAGGGNSDKGEKGNKLHFPRV